jgi:hypothetical protein
MSPSIFRERTPILLPEEEQISMTTCLFFFKGGWINRGQLYACSSTVTSDVPSSSTLMGEGLVAGLGPFRNTT